MDNNDIKTSDFNNAYNRLKQSDKIFLVIKIQAAFRGYMGRKRVQRIREKTGYARAGAGGMFNNHASPDGVNNYDNQDVIVRI